MGSGFHLKIAVSILVVFGLMILGYVLYEPVWWKWQESRLCSDDAATRVAALDSVAGKGSSALPHIRKWLKSPNDWLVASTCLALEKMEGDTWVEVLPELTDILHGEPSARTNAAARVVYKKGDACELFSSGAVTWKHFADDGLAKLNIFVYLLSDSDIKVRYLASNALGGLGDARAVEPLIKALRHDSDSDVRSAAAGALGLLGDTRAIEPLILTLWNDSVSEEHCHAAVALAGFEGTNVENALGAAVVRQNKGAIIALAWRHGGEPLKAMRRLERSVSFWLASFYADALARWGNAAALKVTIGDLPGYLLPHRCFKVDVFSRMPVGFPEFDFKAEYHTRSKQALAIKAWYKKHKHRLAWDAGSRKYYLKPEGEK